VTFEDLRLTEQGDGVRVGVRVRPRASRNAVLGVRDGALDVAVVAPPVDGAANDALCRLLAKSLGLRRSDVHVLTGVTGRNKVILLDGARPEDIRHQLEKTHG
jgi:uncharacterized protein